MRIVPGTEERKEDLIMGPETVYLTGYFDRNFGDDMMMKLVVRSLPEITFLVAAFFPGDGISFRGEQICNAAQRSVAQ